MERASRGWWRGSNDLRREDRTKDYEKSINYFLDTMKTYSFKEREDEEEE